MARTVTSEAGSASPWAPHRPALRATAWAPLCLLTLGAIWTPTSSLAAPGPAGAKQRLARRIVSHMKSKAGLGLDLGCGDASLAVELARQTRLMIQCLDPDQRTVQRARRSIDAAGLYGVRVAANQSRLDKLAYPTGCASLVICGNEFAAGKGQRDFKELFRVLSPNGVAFIGQSAAAKGKRRLTRKQLESWLREAGITSYEIIAKEGVWARVTRPFSEGWDEWTHRSHDPGNTFASRDTLPYGRYRPHWISRFRPGLGSAAVAVANGRIIIASLSYPNHPDTTPYLQALDAFTGVELWARVGAKQLPITRPPGMYSNREYCCDIAAAGDALHLLGGKFCHVFDLRDGKLKRSIPVPAKAKPAEGDVWLYVSCVGELLYGAVGKSPNVRPDWNTMTYRGISKAVFALDRATGRLRWITRTPAHIASITVGGGKLFFVDTDLRLHAFDARTGQEAWVSKLDYPAGTGIAGCSWYREKVFVLYKLPREDKRENLLRGRKLLAAGLNHARLDAFFARDGKRAFKADFGMAIGGMSFSGRTIYASCQHGKGVAAADADTGKMKWKREQMGSSCSPILVSANCLFIHPRHTVVHDLATLRGPAAPQARSFALAGFRPTCSYPALPAYGMLYIQGGGCGCASPIRGNIALIPGRPAPAFQGSRLEKGKAYRRAISAADSGTCWASWRGDLIRSGRSSEKASLPLVRLWGAKLPARVTPVAAGDGKVFFGSEDHKLYALLASTGKKCWQYVADGRVTVAPYLAAGRVYFSDDDGWAYCLAAETGELIWRFRATIGIDRIVGYGQFMSRWPARAGVVVHDGTAYFAAGLFPNERTAVYAVDAKTGQEKWQIRTPPTRRGGRTRGFVPQGAMALANNRLYIPTGAGIPWYVPLDTPDHKPALTKGYHTKGRDIMVVGKDLLAVTPGLQYVWHVHYATPETYHRLPVVTEETIFALNQQFRRVGRFLIAVKRQAYSVTKNRSCVFSLKKEMRGKPLKEYLRWRAWKDVEMTALIEAGRTLFAGGLGKVYATRAADGKELGTWPVPGKVVDLAFQGGRLFVVTDSGQIVCFGKKR